MNQHANEPPQHALEETPRPPAEGQEPSGEKKVEVVLVSESEVAERHGKLRQQISQLEKDVAAGKENAVAATTELEGLRQSWQALEQLADSEEYNRVKDDPEALAAYNRRLALRQEGAEIAQKRAALQQETAEASDIVQWRLDKAIEDKAKETGLSVEDIRACGPQTLEEVSKAAELVAKIKGTPAGTPLPAKAPDSGVTSGGVGWRDLSAEEKLKYAIEHPPKR